MNASTVLPPAMQRVSTLLVQGFQKFLMVAGLVFIAGLIGVQSGRLTLGSFLIPSLSAAELPVADEAAGLADEAPAVSLEPRLSAAMDYV